MDVISTVEIKTFWLSKRFLLRRLLLHLLNHDRLHREVANLHRQDSKLRQSDSELRESIQANRNGSADLLTELKQLIGAELKAYMAGTALDT